mmetsp:Transcript_138072/g.441107  ORF Transcript_138072/g.441107 Transcript_138072/m.441107 type:complete len:372 (-) Transcript_138072:244-1359(-)
MENVLKSGSKLSDEGLHIPRLELNCGLLHFVQHQFQLAAPLFVAAVDPTKDFAARGMGLFHLGICQTCMGQHAEARATWQTLAQMPTKGPVDTVLVMKSQTLSTRKHGIVSAIEVLYLLGRKLAEISRIMLDDLAKLLALLSGVSSPFEVHQVPASEAREELVPLRSADAASYEEQLTVWLLRGIVAHVLGQFRSAEFFLRSVASADLDLIGHDAYHVPYAHFELSLVALSQNDLGPAEECLAAAHVATAALQRRRAALAATSGDDDASTSSQAGASELKMLGFGNGKPPAFSFERALAGNLASVAQEISRRRGGADTTVRENVGNEAADEDVVDVDAAAQAIFGNLEDPSKEVRDSLVPEATSRTSVCSI